MDVITNSVSPKEGDVGHGFYHQRYTTNYAYAEGELWIDRLLEEGKRVSCLIY